MRSGVIILFFILSGLSLYAFTPGMNGDSLLPVRVILNADAGNEAIDTALANIETGYTLTGDNKSTFSRLLKIARLRTSIWNKRLRARLFNDLAGVSARLKLYPLAMKCYDKAEQGLHLPDTVFDQQLDSMLPVCATTASWPVRNKDILSSFDDGKKAAAYAILVHVKQSAPGKRKAFSGINNVGHMFITLIKYNTDNSVAYRSFGFYPRKSSILSATPLHPTAVSTFKDDARHDWDETAGKFISFRRFRKIIGALQSYDQQPYHLNHNNCTDFGLTMAALGGITIGETRGRWPLGKGNNPANAGQSMLEGKLSNRDEEDQTPLFLAMNLPLK